MLESGPARRAGAVVSLDLGGFWKGGEVPFFYDSLLLHAGNLLCSQSAGTVYSRRRD